MIDTKLKLDNFPHKKYSLSAYVLPLSEDLIIGADWLSQNKAVIDFDENSLTLNGQKPDIKLFNAKKSLKNIKDDFDPENFVLENYKYKEQPNELGKIYDVKIRLNIDTNQGIPSPTQI